MVSQIFFLLIAIWSKRKISKNKSLKEKFGTIMYESLTYVQFFLLKNHIMECTLLIFTSGICINSDILLLNFWRPKEWIKVVWSLARPKQMCLVLNYYVCTVVHFLLPSVHPIPRKKDNRQDTPIKGNYLTSKN